MNVFDNLKVLKYQKTMGDASKLDGNFLFQFDCMMYDLFIDRGLNVHCGFELSGHISNSFHYRGLAFDFDLKKPELLKEDFILIDNYFSKRQIKIGLGLYTWWNNKGFHLDIGGRDHTVKWISNKKGLFLHS